MKKIKSEEYKGYQIIVNAEFKEGTSKEYSTTSFNPIATCDSVQLEVKYYQGNSIIVGYGMISEKSKVVERQDNHEKLYESLNKEIDRLVTKVKGDIDKKVREKEMTDGLPESLLKKESIEDEIRNSELHYMASTGDEPNTIFLGKKQIEMLSSLVGVEDLSKRKVDKSKGLLGKFTGLNVVEVAGADCLYICKTVE